MMEERYHATTQNRFYPDMSNVNKNITVEAKLISPPYVILQPPTLVLTSHLRVTFPSGFCAALFQNKLTYLLHGAQSFLRN